MGDMAVDMVDMVDTIVARDLLKLNHGMDMEVTMDVDTVDTVMVVMVVMVVMGMVDGEASDLLMPKLNHGMDMEVTDMDVDTVMAVMVVMVGTADMAVDITGV